MICIGDIPFSCCLVYEISSNNVGHLDLSTFGLRLPLIFLFKITAKALLIVSAFVSGMSSVGGPCPGIFNSVLGQNT